MDVAEEETAEVEWEEEEEDWEGETEEEQEEEPEEEQEEEHEEDYQTKGICSFISEDMSLNCYLFSYCFQMDGEDDDYEW